MSSLFIGLMSGTSADAIDAALVDFALPQPRLVARLSLPLSSAVRGEIIDLFNPGANEIERMGALDRQLGVLFAQAVNELLALSGVSAGEITAIGSHGQTLRHRPRLHPHAFTVQIGDPSTLAELTGITTIADFRRRDIACVGQGAPLAPGFHQAVFGAPSINRAVLNLGGIANVTYLPGRAGRCSGFDTGPASGLMDHWIHLCRQLAFDAQGQWASSGKVDPVLLQLFQQHPFFALAPPKSTGKEEFTPGWLASCVAQCAVRPADADVQATLLELTAWSITDALRRFCWPLEELYLCGGGAFNTQLRLRLAQLLPEVTIDTTAALGIDVQWVEAMAFAWLAMRTVHGLSGNLPEVTGARHLAVLGGIYPGRGFKGFAT